MNRSLSFYEFAGIIVPSIILLFFCNLLLAQTREIEVIDFSKIGESIIFLIISYGFGHLLHAVGNGFENVVWWVAGGKPSKWLLKKNSFGKSLFDADLTNKIKQKLHGEFGALTTDYDRLVLTKIRVANK